MDQRYLDFLRRVAGFNHAATAAFHPSDFKGMVDGFANLRRDPTVTNHPHYDTVEEHMVTTHGFNERAALMVATVYRTL